VPPGYYPRPQPADGKPKRSKRTKITAGAILGGAASIATILTLFLTLDQQPQPQQQNSPNHNGVATAANAYPVNVQSNFLNSCESNGSVSVCECSLSWFQQHVPMSQFEQDETDIEQGGSPVDIASVERACG
jgi:hypothetical protein